MSTKNIFEVNGLKVAFYHIGEIKSASICLKIKIGSWYEGDKWGQVHLLEHMLIQGSEKFPSKEELENYCEENGLVSRVVTSGSQIELSVKFPADNLKSVLNYISEIIFKSSLNERAIEVEKKIIEREYHDKWSKPEIAFNLRTNSQIFGATHPYVRDGLGNIDKVKATTRDDLLQIYNKYFVLTNIVMSISGNFEENLLNESIRMIFPQETAQVLPILEVPMAKSETEKLEIEEVGRNSTLLKMSWLIDGSDNLSLQDRIALRIFSYILGGGRRSALFKEIRDKLGMVYSIDSKVGFYPKAGWFQVNSAVNPKEVDLVISKTNEIIKTIIQTEFSEGVFDRAKKFLKYQNIFDFDSSFGAAQSLGNNLFWDGLYVSPKEYGEMVDSVDQDTARGLAKKYLLSSEPSIAILKPKV